MNIEKHLFICTSCKTQSGEEGVGLKIHKSLKAHFKQSHSNLSLRVNKSGCLGRCRFGVNAVCYPEGKWFEKLTFDQKDLLEMELKS